VGGGESAHCFGTRGGGGLVAGFERSRGITSRKKDGMTTTRIRKTRNSGNGKNISAESMPPSEERKSRNRKYGLFQFTCPLASKSIFPSAVFFWLPIKTASVAMDRNRVRQCQGHPSGRDTAARPEDNLPYKEYQKILHNAKYITLEI
jgi:hypothetical protein